MCDEMKEKLAIDVLQSFYSITKILSEFTLKNANELGVTVKEMSILNILSNFSSINKVIFMEKIKGLDLRDLDRVVELLIKKDLIKIKENNLSLSKKGKLISDKSKENEYSYKAIILALESFEIDKIKDILDINTTIIGNLEKIK
ncbi:MAG: hypothetical protein ACRC41_02300 [Sarcina sp.]